MTAASPRAEYTRRYKEARRVASLSGRDDVKWCPCCELPVTEKGLPAHYAAHRHRGDTFHGAHFICILDCTTFGSSEELAAHRKAVHPRPTTREGRLPKGALTSVEKRELRYRFVSSIARLPYREFVGRLLEPWVPER